MRREFKWVTYPRHNLMLDPDILNRIITIDAPSKAWVSDIMYIWRPR